MSELDDADREPMALADVLRLMAQAQEIEDKTKASAPADSSGPPDDSASAEPSDEVTTEQALAAIQLRRLEMKLDQRKQILEQRKTLARYALWIVIAQLALANLFFGLYLVANLVDPNGAIMVAWLSATVVEVIGILWVIARSLFPYRDKPNPKGTPDKLPSSLKP